MCFYQETIRILIYTFGEGMLNAYQGQQEATIEAGLQ